MMVTPIIPNLPMKSLRRQLAIIATLLVSATPAQPQSLQLSGISSYWSSVNGTYSSAFWTTDHTPTPHNWFGIWVSASSGGAFLPGASSSDLGQMLGAGANDVYAVLDSESVHAGSSAYQAFNLFFNNEIVPRFSIVTPTSTYGSYSSISSSVLIPQLRYENGPFVNATGSSSFTYDGFVYTLAGFDERQGSDRVYANLATSDGYNDPEFHFRLTVTSVVPEPATAVLVTVGVLLLLTLRRRRGVGSISLK